MDHTSPAFCGPVLSISSAVQHPATPDNAVARHHAAVGAHKLHFQRITLGSSRRGFFGSPVAFRVTGSSVRFAGIAPAPLEGARGLAVASAAPTFDAEADDRAIEGKLADFVPVDELALDEELADDEYVEEDIKLPSEDRISPVPVMIGDMEPVPPSISDFRVSEEAVKTLARRGINAFTPIQFETFDAIYDGRDVIGRSRTGTGKTMAFALPIVERMKTNVRKTRGRGPECLVLTPTRELCKQVAHEFELLGKELEVATIYGGTSYVPQENALRRGIDVLVATPGRLMDLMDRCDIDFSEIKVAILDEADEMLRVGFADDVERIFSMLPEERQSLLFSATVPSWVNKVSKKYMDKPLSVDTIGTSVMKAAETVRHIAVQVFAKARSDILSDLIAVYGKERVIIFTRTKKDADDLAVHIHEESQVLHGDIAQYQRELTLGRFREGRFRVLIATDVAARGIDIPAVDLVVQYELPFDSETYIHRSGRTGRAGRDGTAIVLFTPEEQRSLRQMEREIGVKFEIVPVPMPEDVLRALSAKTVVAIDKVKDEVLPFFEESATRLLEEQGPRAMAAALAAIAGVTHIKRRSALTSIEGMTCVLIRNNAPMSLGAIKAIIGRVFPEAVGAIGRMELCAEGGLCDLPADMAKELVGLQHDERSLSFEIPETLPRLLSRDEMGRGGGRGRFDRGGGRGDRDRRGGGGRGGRGGDRYGGERRRYGGDRDDRPRRAPREGGYETFDPFASSGEGRRSSSRFSRGGDSGGSSYGGSSYGGRSERSGGRGGGRGGPRRDSRPEYTSY
eukprot:tig00000093_g3579.t1